jgi:predicted dehydrogenase
VNRVRVGVVGTGSIFYGWDANSGHLHAYQNVREAQVVALCDTNEARLQQAAATLRARFEEEARLLAACGDEQRARDLRQDAKDLKLFTDAAAMFTGAGLDLVDIMASPKAHAPLSIKALQAGLHVFCEKPMTRTWLDCLPVLDAVAASGKLFGCAENLMFESPWYDAKKQVDAGAVGQPLLLSLSLGIREVLPVRWSADLSGGGALTDMGIHAIVTAWSILGFQHRPVRAQALRPIGVALRMPERLVGGTFERLAVEDDAHIVFDLEHPVTGARIAVQIEASFSGQDRPGNRVVGSTGELALGSPLKVYDAWGNAHDVPTQQPPTAYAVAEGQERPYSGFVGMIREMCRCVQTGRTPVYDATRAAEAMALIGACYLSEMCGGKSVSIEEFKEYALSLRRRDGETAADSFIRQVSEHIAKSA